MASTISKITATFLAFVCAWISIPAWATTMKELTLEQIVEHSQAIVHGEVQDSTCRWNDGNSLIVTDTRIQVATMIKGTQEAVITVTQPGGTVGNIRMEVPGAHAYLPGSEVVLCLSKLNGELQVVGLDQGRFDVEEDPRTESKWIRSRHSALRIKMQEKAGRSASDEPAPPLILDDFLSILRKTAQASSGEGQQ